MTSDEIKASLNPPNDDAWLREIAYQLAVMNERQDVPKLKDNPFGVAHDEPSKRDAVPSDYWKSAWPPLPADATHAEHLDRIARVQFVPSVQDLIGEFMKWRLKHSGVREEPLLIALRFMHDWIMAKSVPSASPEPAGQDSSPSNMEDLPWFRAQRLREEIAARDLMKKTDREQNG